jgi:hypothetical protein
MLSTGMQKGGCGKTGRLSTVRTGGKTPESMDFTAHAAGEAGLFTLSTLFTEQESGRTALFSFPGSCDTIKKAE